MLNEGYILVFILLFIPMAIIGYGRIFFWVFSDDIKKIYKEALREIYDENTK